ncbi:unnamed protein product [Clonostachys rhizophaga]|uniref:NB-ARC domain-containing protein n=1 Tax=Clonostachys rhizophaga TaxID=160324 RepID=A0A9N9YNB0_9HYPO|nr:unnamed protein product [Clonostachys rhizophaga]
MRALAAMIQGLPAQFTFFEGRKTKVDENDYRLLVYQHSGSYGRPWETSKEYVRSIDADHKTMIKFSPTSEVYNEISFFLRTYFIPEAPHTIKKRLMHLRSEVQDLPSTHVTNQPFGPSVLPQYMGDQVIQHREGVVMKMTHCLETTGNQFPAFYLYGIGGVGKTQAALKYIAERSYIYKRILWANASTAVELASDFDCIAAELDCKVNETMNPEANREAVKVWLQNNSDWLLVFDGADDVSHLSPFWPSAKKGCIIITSRSPKIAYYPMVTGGARLDCFSEEDGAQVLSRISEDLHDYELAKQISRRLGGLPLAIAQVASIIASRSITLADFLEKYDQSGPEVVERSDNYATSGYRGDLATVWNLQFSRLSAVSQSLMEVLSLLHPDYIQLDVLATIMKWGERALWNALRELANNALVQKDNSGDESTHFLVIHRLVQDAYRCTWAPETWQRAFNEAYSCIDSKFLKQDRGQTMVPLYRECRKYESHVLSLITHFTSRQDLLDPSVEFVETLAHCGW